MLVRRVSDQLTFASAGRIMINWMVWQWTRLYHRWRLFWKHFENVALRTFKLRQNVFYRYVYDVCAVRPHGRESLDLFWCASNVKYFDILKMLNISASSRLRGIGLFPNINGARKHLGFSSMLCSSQRFINLKLKVENLLDILCSYHFVTG